MPQPKIKYFPENFKNSYRGGVDIPDEVGACLDFDLVNEKIENLPSNLPNKVTEQSLQTMV